MSMSNLIRGVVTAFLLTIVAQTVVRSQEASDDVLDYYLKNVKRAIKTRSPVNNGTSYYYTSTTLYKYTNSHGKVGRVDTISVKFFHSWGKFDSAVVIKGDSSLLESMVPEYDDIFNQEYLFQTFPNDTGGIDFAIGFDTPNNSLPQPVGLLIINRDNFTPRWLYLFYPKKSGYKRFSKAWRFTELEGLIFPDSVWIVAAKEGVFGTDNYRIETGISDLTITHPSD